MSNIIVLGGGLVGKAIAIDLAKNHKVTCADIRPDAIQFLTAKYQIQVCACDFRNHHDLSKLIAPFDLVVAAVPGFMGFEVLKTVIENGKNVVDISFFPEDPFLLDQLAKEKNVTAIVDCGVAPGMCNILAGYHQKQTKITAYECMVGGLPVAPQAPFNYRAVFSPIDVIEEYTRPARYIENGAQVVREALTDIEPVYFEQTGELEAFNTDGLRTLAVTMPEVPNMKEKTLRYPGHARLMEIFRETGFFNKEAIDVKGQKIIPLEVTANLLFKEWKMLPGEQDFTVMRVVIEDEQEIFTYLLYDRYDQTTDTTSMARTTGYTCTAAVNLFLDGKYDRKGISPPEYVGNQEGCLDYVLNYLRDRNVVYKLEKKKK